VSTDLDTDYTKMIKTLITLCGELLPNMLHVTGCRAHANTPVTCNIYMYIHVCIYVYMYIVVAARSLHSMSAASGML